MLVEGERKRFSGWARAGRGGDFPGRVSLNLGSPEEDEPRVPTKNESGLLLLGNLTKVTILQKP